MRLPALTAVAPRWEVDLVAALAPSDHVHVVRRCADVAELLGVAAAGLGRVAFVSSDLRGVDRSVLDALTLRGVMVVGVHPPDDDAAARTLTRWGCPVVVPADTSSPQLDDALEELLRGADARERSASAGVGAVQEEGRSGRGPGVPGAPAKDRPAGLDPDGLDEELEQLLDEAGGGARGQGLGPDASLDDQGGGREGEVVVVWGPTGSPGRTTVAVNLAVELADPLGPVVLVDADTYGASVAQHLAVLDEVPGVAAAVRAADQGTLDRVSLARLAPELRPGLRVLTGLPRADRWPELRDVALADVLQACRSLARWTVVDVAAYLEQDEELSFDTLAPRRNGATLTALEAADHLVVVGSADPVGLQRLVRGLDLLREQAVDPTLIVVNRVRSGAVGPEPGRRITEALRRFAGVEPAVLVPDDVDAMDAAMLQGRALAEVRPRSTARTALVDLANQLSGRPAQGSGHGRRHWPRRHRRAART
ncbi:AAA family ATPase [Ornithinimicrobium tianjinense]|uniref:Pilus biosynthesis protein CpaE n=1 Tax=Ornithinimicrobium tianjinense TaxID=1195761 RepID=A0A917F2B0_9MICO|nr:hypothetical protein [Ornithinimicrobium tianjinense]GGF43160.1 pilus biosynthesis protein CpaE [Ornithinimicrobium tianjinense]